MNTPVSPAAGAGAAPRGRLQLLLLATLFFFPLLASYVLYFGFPELRPSGTVNYGDLVLPTQVLPDDLGFSDAEGAALDTDQLLRHRWSFVVTTDADCPDDCLRALIMTRQVRAATNEKRSRVQRVLVLRRSENLQALAAKLAPEHPDLRIVAESADPGRRLSEVLSTRSAQINLVDPHGNWVMSYPGGRDTQADFKGMGKDIGKLLRLSQIG